MSESTFGCLGREGRTKGPCPPMDDEHRAIVERNMGLVRKVAFGFKNSGRAPDTPEDDLVQAGMMGLIDASYRFQEDVGTGFSTYAIHYITGYIWHEIKRCRVIAIRKRGGGARAIALDAMSRSRAEGLLETRVQADWDWTREQIETLERTVAMLSQRDQRLLALWLADEDAAAIGRELGIPHKKVYRVRQEIIRKIQRIVNGHPVYPERWKKDDWSASLLPGR